MKFKSILACGLAMGVAVLASPLALATDLVVQDMHQAFKANDRKTLSALLPKAQGHALESWAGYWELKARLAEATPDEVNAYLTRHSGTYAEDRMRNDWLLLLGQRRDWAAFEAEFTKFRMRDDRELNCYAAVIAHLKTGADTAAEVKHHWHAQRDADDGCNFAADRLFDAKRLSANDVWLKARLAIEANRLRAASRAVEIVSPEYAPKLAEAYGKPSAVIKRATASRAGKEMQLLAVIRLATLDAVAAATELSRAEANLSSEQRSYAWGVVGKYANLKLDPQALQHFAQAKTEHLSDDLLAWQARAALRASQWNTVRRSIEAMSPAAQSDATWIHWRAEALTRLGHAGDAQKLLERIASPRGFYELMAMEKLGRPILAPTRPEALTALERDAARQHPGLRRALALIGLGLRPEGVREWNYSTSLETPGGMTDRQLLAAAQWACEQQVWDRCINTSERSKDAFDHEQRFPMPFKDAVLARTKSMGLDPAYVYGLIRQESRFITDARSHVGASGLMQVMPPTAKWTAKRIGLTQFKPSDITDIDTNIHIGTGYLKLVLDDMGGSEPLAAAAYNAGPGRPRAWRNGPTLDGAIWAENIPFNETRDYVKKVSANATLYAAIITGKPQSIRERVGQIGPRSAQAPDDNKELP